MQYKKRNKSIEFNKTGSSEVPKAARYETKAFKEPTEVFNDDDDVLGATEIKPKPFEGAKKSDVGELSIKANLASLKKKAPVPTAEKVESKPFESANTDAYKERIKKRMK